MRENDTEREGQDEGLEDRPEPPEPGYPVEETEPAGGLPPEPHEHPEDVEPPPDPGQTESPGSPSDPDAG